MYGNRRKRQERSRNLRQKLLMRELIVALDYPSAREARGLVDRLKGLPITYKVGFELFIAEGPAFVRELRGAGAEVFLDLKLHDIPNTVQKAVQSAIGLDVKYLTIHLAGQKEMLMQSQNAVEQAKSRLILLGVTVLTSMNELLWKDLGKRVNGKTSDFSIGQSVTAFAELAKETGIPGLISSPLELKTLREKFPSLRVITPGIRLEASHKDDQVRTLSPKEAKAAGAHGIVVGRPITQAVDPRTVAEGILKDLA